MKKRELDNILDEVTAGIRSEQIDNAAMNDARDRVWSRMNDASRMLANRRQDVGAPAEAPTASRIEGCADFQSLIPAYLNGGLSEARSLLLVDHTHECIPCRKALKNARESRVATPARTATVKQRRTPKYSLQPVILRWGIAAALLIGLGLIALPIIQRYMPFGSLEATVQAADGPLYSVTDSKTRRLNVGEKIQRGEVIRTAKDGRAVVKLGDGSTIEMKDRSEFSMSKAMSGVTVHLDS
ncbi:MAG TPA: zf-HC2 domain-containing protein, partial [Pyrinomonadaceae bacterium]|nr:zf-HC2 domain-containing protein [Pyrinomonadaceae bacterium]